MGSKYFVDVINAGEQSVSVSGGADADLKLTEGSNTWTVRHNGSDSDLEFLYNNEERLMVAEDGSIITQTADTATNADYEVSVDDGQISGLRLKSGSDVWQIAHRDEQDGAIGLRYNASTKFLVRIDGSEARQVADAATDAELRVKVDSGQDSSINLEEGTNDWKITNNGTSGRLSIAYNDAEAFAVSDGLFPVVPSYTVASLPTAESGGMIFVTDETGGAVLAFGDATGSPAVWRRVTDRAVVS